jgi:hypothetical protein
MSLDFGFQVCNNSFRSYGVEEVGGRSLINPLGPLMRDGLKEVVEGNAEFPAIGVYPP